MLPGHGYRWLCDLCGIMGESNTLAKYGAGMVYYGGSHDHVQPCSHHMLGET